MCILIIQSNTLNFGVLFKSNTLKFIKFLAIRLENNNEYITKLHRPRIERIKELH